jgi:hypothetical protein
MNEASVHLLAFSTSGISAEIVNSLNRIKGFSMFDTRGQGCFAHNGLFKRNVRKLFA